MQHCIKSFISKEDAGKASVGVAALPGASQCLQALAGEKRAKKRWTLVANRYTQ
jgi:hypothetical protein